MYSIASYSSIQRVQISHLDVNNTEYIKKNMKYKNYKLFWSINIRIYHTKTKNLILIV